MNRRVLIVDDEENVVRHLTLGLRNRGWEVFAASTLPEADAAFAAYGPPVVVTDLHLTPLRRSEGIDLMRRIKGLQSRTYVVVISGGGSPEAEEAALEGGADAVVLKPFELRSFMDDLDRLASLSRESDGDTP